MNPKKYSAAPLLAAIKRELKVRSLTYRDVAKALGVSENSIKLSFSRNSLSVEHIMAIAELLDLTMSELMQKMEHPPVRQLSVKQEASLLGNIQMLLVLVHIMDDWTLDDITGTYDITKAECLRHVLELERLGFVELMPHNRIRRRISRNLDWTPDGPFHRHIAAHMGSFLNSRFDGKHESRHVLRGSLTPVAIEQLQTEMRLLKQRFGDLHDESLIAPLDQRRRIVLYMAEREWELDDFVAMRRKKTI